jgi:ferredoxin
MATLSDRIPENAPGRYYVDSNCIDCDQCRTQAPDLFGRNADSGYSFVQHQPGSPEAVALAEQVLEACPNQAIGNDGA